MSSNGKRCTEHGRLGFDHIWPHADGGAATVDNVRLLCAQAVHEERVRAPERKAFGKITSQEQLRGAMARWNLAAAVPFRPSLEIDNSALGAEWVARRIAERLSLPVVKA